MHIKQRSKIDQAEALAKTKRDFNRSADKLAHLLAALGVEVQVPAERFDYLGTLDSVSAGVLENLTKEAGQEALDNRMNAPVEAAAP